MAYNFVAASSQNLNANAGFLINGATAATLAFWAKRTGATIQVCAFAETANVRFFANAFSDGNLYCATENGALSQSTVTLGGATGWLHLCLVFDGGQATASARHRVFINGSLRSPSISGSPPTSLNSLTTFRIGRQNLAGQNTTGDIADVAIWSSALAEDDVAALYKGFPPKRISPHSLALYAPLIRNINDVRSSVAFTNSGGATVADHVRRYG